MRVQRVRQARAFTLVEILIVVIILGILATIIIGLFSNGTKDASAASLKDNLRSMRSQLQLYVAQHGNYPALATFEQQMTYATMIAPKLTIQGGTTEILRGIIARGLGLR